jgi:hypothetical protein
MKKYRLSVTEEIGGYIVVEAKNEKKAEKIAEELLDEYGCQDLFYNHNLTKYQGDQTHGDREVFGCEEIK